MSAKSAPWAVEDLDVMPFGKQKGLPLDQVDTGMLKWWLGKMDSDDLRTEYREAVTAVLAARGTGPPRPSKATNGMGSARLILAAEFRCMIKAWFGQMSMKYHPDRGGSNEQQIVVIEAYKSMISELERWESGK